jgi:mannose-6-phosphate isomerase-like protein (cupin superfamily)
MSEINFSSSGTGTMQPAGYEGGTGNIYVRQVNIDGLAADWRSLRFVRITAGASIGPRVLIDSEVIVYVYIGEALAIVGGVDTSAIEKGATLALPLGAQYEIINNGTVDVELIIAELGVRNH